MRKQLTAEMIEKLKPPASGRVEIFDKIVPAMALRVTSNGGKSFVVRCRVKGWPNPIRVTIGDATAMKLTDARQEASDVLKACRAGVDPREVRKAKAEEAERQRKSTFAAVAEDFIQQHVVKLRSKKYEEAEIRRHLIAHWGKRSIAGITADDVAERIKAIADNGTPHMARLVLAHAKSLFRWAAAPGRARRTGLRGNPCDGVTAKDLGISNIPRQVVLSSDHVRLIWKATLEWTATDPLGEPFALCIRMLLLSGQRRDEVAGMTWSELYLDRDQVWIIPAERMKGKRAHEVPLSASMVAMLKKMREGRGKGDFVFSTTLGQRPISGFSKAKLALDEKIGELHEKERVEVERHGTDLPKIAFPVWRIHDIRRTMRTGLGAIPSIPHDIRELVIAHVPPDLVRTYDLHGYREEKREALELWAQRLKGIAEAAAKAPDLLKKPTRAAE
jgi:integrase